MEPERIGRGRPIIGSFRSKLLNETEDKELSGIGDFTKQEAVRYPGSTVNVSDQSQESKEKKHGYGVLNIRLYDLCKVKIDETSVEAFYALAKELCTTTNDVTEICHMVYEFSLQNLDNACKGVEVFKIIRGLEVGQENIRKELMRQLQKDYEGKDQIFKQSKSRFRMIAFFIAEVLLNFRLANGLYLDFLVGPTIDFFTALLDDLEGLKLFSIQIAKVHPVLKVNEPYKFLKMYRKVRALILSPMPNESERVLLLRLLEQFLRDYEPFPEEIEEFYGRYKLE